MINLSLIPIFAFILILLPIAIISFFKSIRWALMLLGLTLVAGTLSFLITFILYKPLLLGWFENILTWRLGEDMALDQMEKISKGTIIGIFSTFIILPLALVIFLVFKLIKKWLNKPLGPKVTVISPNEKSIVRKSLKFQKIGSGVISTSTALIIASTIASSTSIVLTPAYKNKFFNKMIKPFSFPLNYGNGYDKNWQRLYAFLDSANKNKTGLSGLRELISFDSFKGDLTPQEKGRLEQALAKIDTSELNNYFTTIDDNSDLTDIAIRVLLGKFVYGLDHKIMASDQSETTEEADFDKFLSDFDSWANSNINKNNLFLKNKIGVEKAIRSLLNQNHDYKDTYYYKNEVEIKDLIKYAEKMLTDSHKEYDRLTAEKQNADEQYKSDFRRMKSIARALHQNTRLFLEKREEIGKGDHKNIKSNFDSLPKIIQHFITNQFLTKNLSDGLGNIYNEKTGKLDVRPPGPILSDKNLQINKGVDELSTRLIQKYITAYKDVYGINGTKRAPDSGSPYANFDDAKNKYNQAQDKTRLAKNNLDDLKRSKAQTERNIRQIKNNIAQAESKKSSLESERDQLIISINNQKIELQNAQGSVDQATTLKNTAETELQAAETNLSQQQNIFDKAKQFTKTALENKEKTEKDYDKADKTKNPSDFNQKKQYFEDAKSDWQSKKAIEATAKDNLDKAIKRKNTAEHEFQKVERDLKSKNKILLNIQNQYNQKLSYLQKLQGWNGGSIARISTPSSGEIGRQINEITILRGNLRTKETSFASIITSIDGSNGAKEKYNNAFQEEKVARQTFNQANIIYEPLRQTLARKEKDYENASDYLNQKYQDIVSDINEIDKFEKDFKKKWKNLFLPNSKARWEINGEADSFSPKVKTPTPISRPNKSDPDWVEKYKWPDPNKDYFLSNVAAGSKSKIYLQNRISYLKDWLNIASEIKVSMKKRYNDRLESLTDSITKILT